jgi:hypothetical protein
VGDQRGQDSQENTLVFFRSLRFIIYGSKVKAQFGNEAHTEGITRRAQDLGRVWALLILRPASINSSTNAIIGYSWDMAQTYSIYLFIFKFRDNCTISPWC